MNLLLLVIAGCAYLANQLILKGIGVDFFHSYFNDVLAALILLAWSNLIARPAPAVARWVGSISGSAIIIGGASLVWEVATPQLLATSRSDPLDVAAYLVGGAIYVCLVALVRHRASAR